MPYLCTYREWSHPAIFPPGSTPQNTLLGRTFSGYVCKTQNQRRLMIKHETAFLFFVVVMTTAQDALTETSELELALSNSYDIDLYLDEFVQAIDNLIERRTCTDADFREAER